MRSQAARLLVLNCGSSSVKYKLLDARTGGQQWESVAAETVVVGARTHTETIEDVLHRVKAAAGGEWPSIVGHRVVHGGKRFREATILDEEAEAHIRSLSPLAPLHAQPNAEGVRCSRTAFPHAAHVGVFDTAFHSTLPPHAATYTLPPQLEEALGARKYGFHGTSFRFVVDQAKERGIENLVAMHLGAGSSVCAIEAGRSVDTSMGMTPLEGLIGNTRCGDVDASVVPLLQGHGVDALRILNNESGLWGLTDGEEHTIKGIVESLPRFDHALDTYCYRVRKYLASYVVGVLSGECDGIVFTGGVGENAWQVRERVCRGLGCIGVRLDEERNMSYVPVEIGEIHSDESAVRVLVIPANEEEQIAREALQCVLDNSVVQ